MKWSGLLLCALLACKSGGANSEVRAMGQQHDVNGLLEAWAQAEADGTRVAVLEALSGTPDDARARTLVAKEAAGQTSPEVRVAALRVLPSFEGPEVTSTLIEGLGDPWPAARQVAKSGLEAKGEASHGPLLEAGVNSSHHLVRASSLQLLVAAAKKTPALKKPVEQALFDRAQKDDAPNVRTAAADGVGELGLEAGRRMLRELETTDADSSVRLAASRAIQKLGNPPEEKTAVVAVLPLRDASEGQDPELSRLSRELGEYVTARLGGAKLCQVVDREKVELAISEIKKIGRAVYDGDSPNAPELGKFKIANQVVFGSVSRQGLRYTLILNRMDLSTLALVPGASASVSGYKADLPQLKVELADRFLSCFR